MQFYNLADNQQSVLFDEAVLHGLGRRQGLFFPKSIPEFTNIQQLLDLPFVDRSVELLLPFVEPCLNKRQLYDLVAKAFNFDCPLIEIEDNLWAFELFHGPSLAFKDFGARFLAQCLQHFHQHDSLTILTATSGDTGAAVAKAFHRLPNIRVSILYPENGVTRLQRKLFSTLGDNIESYAVQGSFDQCQAMVKQAFSDRELQEKRSLNSANSINIARLLAQVCYYFEAVAQLKKRRVNTDSLRIAVPSGNFGNVTAALIAYQMGLPFNQVIAATNSNDTVPRFLENNHWQPTETKQTLSNAMDVSKPNNWPRVATLLQLINHPDCLRAVAVSEKTTRENVLTLLKKGYLSEPHAAVAYSSLQPLTEQPSIMLATAAPIKFHETVSQITGHSFSFDQHIREVLAKPCLSKSIKPDYLSLRTQLLL